MMFACIHSPSADLPAIAAAFSPSFEQTAPDTVLFRIDGLARLHGSPHQIAQAIANRAGPGINVAIAETADAAILAAHNFAGVTVSPISRARYPRFRSPKEMAEVLESWGIHTLEQLAELPENGLAERFGPQRRPPAAARERRNPPPAQNLQAGNHLRRPHRA